MSPIYDFECKPCRTNRTLHLPVERYNDVPRCPKCNNLMSRVYSPVITIFKGNGWTPGSGRGRV